MVLVLSTSSARPSVTSQQSHRRRPLWDSEVATEVTEVRVSALRWRDWTAVVARSSHQQAPGDTGSQPGCAVALLWGATRSAEGDSLVCAAHARTVVQRRSAACRCSVIQQSGSRQCGRSAPPSALCCLSGCVRSDPLHRTARSRYTTGSKPSECTLSGPPDHMSMWR